MQAHLLLVIKKVTALLEYQDVLPFQDTFSFLKSIVPDMEVRGQLACPRAKQKHKERSYNLYIPSHMCLYVCTHCVMHPGCFFTCIKVSKSHNSCTARVECVKHELLEQTTCCWVGQSKQNQVGNMFEYGEGLSLTPRQRPRWRHSRGAAEDSLSSMYGCDAINS